MKNKYISVKEAAEKWNLSERRVQQFCKQGLIAKIQRDGRSWLIPVNAVKPNVKKIDETGKAVRQKSGIKPDSFMPLTGSAFPLGKCETYIKQFAKHDQNLVWAEFYYFSGQAEKAATLAQPYLQHNNLKKKLSANILYGFASLSLGHINSARFALNNVKKTLKPLKKKNIDQSTKAVCVYAASMGCVLLHLPDDDVPPLKDYIKYLPDGLKQYACYILAHKTYLHKNYEGALCIADIALSWTQNLYPIPAIYLHIIAAVCAMNLKRTEEATKHFRLAWEIAGPDGLIEAIGEHHGLLQGLIEAILKPEFPEDYQKVIAITYSFSSGWRKIHNPDTHREVADDLTTTEFTIAMLIDRGWTYQEIGQHMKLSPNTVNKYLSGVYQRLGINTKEELHDYMLY